MNAAELNEIICNHRKWLDREPGGVRANLREADLSEADLYGANLREADLSGANLRGANLSGANLREVDLRRANLYEANLSEADLRGADLSGAILRRANLREADLSRAENVPPLMETLVPPDTGAFVAWKKVWVGEIEYIVKLQIPEDAERSSATTRKCRASAAKVLEIQMLDGSPSGLTEITNRACWNETVYRVGEVTLPDGWDENRWNECSHGIHFFITRQEAVDY